MGCSGIICNSAGLMRRSARKSGFRTDASGSRAPNARSAATTMDVRDGCPGPKPEALGMIVVHAAAGFLSEPSVLHILHEQRARTVFLAECLVEEGQNIKTRIEADEVNHLERPHRAIQS